MSLIIYNKNNSQEIALNGLVDNTGAPIAGAVITGTLQRNGVPLLGGAITFTSAGQPGNYVGMLSGFDSTLGSAQLVLVGNASGATFNIVIFVTITQRNM